MITRANFERRLRALEKKVAGPSKLYVVNVRSTDDTQEQAMARSIAERGAPDRNDKVINVQYCRASEYVKAKQKAGAVC